MPRLRRLSSSEVVRILGKHGFEVYSQRGSHLKLRQRSRSRRGQIVVVPRNPDLPAGTIRSIYKQALQSVPEHLLRPDFYTD